jgi:hypothetical protein
MQSMEIVLYMLVAIIVGGMVVSVLGVVNYQKQYHDFTSLFGIKEAEKYKIESKDFPIELSKSWEKCRLGIDDMSFTVYVEDNSTLDRQTIADGLFRIGKCDDIDCRNHSNGLIVPNSIITPKVINIHCLNNTLIIK